MKYFFVYYMNLMFSALSPAEQKTVVDSCLDPLLGLAEQGHKFALQISGVSLEIINDYRPDLIIKIKKLIEANEIDFIGNGYSQVIQPLFPNDINQKNQKIGLEVYREILGVVPRICTINEMAFSSGSCESISDVGYDTILMEWNNAKALNGKEFPNQFSKARIDINGNELDVLWCDTIAFQKFQKYVHGEWELDDYLVWLTDYTSGQKGSLCLYCSDAEIFNFRPKRYGTEIPTSNDEWHRIKELMIALSPNTIYPSQVQKNTDEPILISNTNYPIVVKKQHKYNINRWALTGKDDQKLNTTCLKIFRQIFQNKVENSSEKWKKLLKICSSDLRTHIHQERWNNAKVLINEFQNEMQLNQSTVHGPIPLVDAEIKNLKLDPGRGNNIAAWPLVKSVIGKVDSHKFTKVNMMVDNYSGFSVIEKLGHRKISDLDYKSSQFISESETKNITESGYSIHKRFIYSSENRLHMNTKINVPARSREQIKINNFSFHSNSWDFKTLKFKTHLGGSKLEEFNIGSDEFNHDEILNLNVLGINGFSPTENKIIISDKDKKLTFQTQSDECFSLARFEYQIDDNNEKLLRLVFVVQDIDETFRTRETTEEFNFDLNISLCHVS